MQQYAGDLHIILVSGILGLIFLWIAKDRGYFQLPEEKVIRSVQFKTVLGVFVIYLSVILLIAPLLAKFLELFIYEPTLRVVLGILQLFLLLGIITLFYFFCKSQSPTLFQKIWKNRTIVDPKPIYKDVCMGILSWMISFPLVIAVGLLSDLLLYFFFGFENYEQVAVGYLKESLGSPFLFAVALITILLIAPIIEEFSFRGCLQNYFKRHMRPQWAIVASALCFAIFHFAPSQGLGNVSLIASLFVFALFLGFIYERQASLFASVALHMTFNAVNSVRIIFFS